MAKAKRAISPEVAGAQAVRVLEPERENRSRRVQLVFTPSALEAIDAAAKIAGASRNDWSLRVLSAAAGVVLEAERRRRKEPGEAAPRSEPFDGLSR